MGLYIDGYNIEEVKREGNKVYLKLDEEKTEDLIYSLIEEFINTGKLRYLEFAFICNPEKFKKYFEGEIGAEFDKYKGDIFHVLDKKEVIEQKFGIDIERIIKQNKKHISRLPPSNLVLLFKKIQFDDRFKELVITEKVEYLLDGYYDYEKNIEDIIQLSQINKELVKKAVSKNFDTYILNTIKINFGDFCGLGRGRYFEKVRDRIIAIDILHENGLLEEECIKKFKEFISENLEKINKLIKRRIKKENHQDYIKVLIKFLPPEFQIDYISFFI